MEARIDAGGYYGQCLPGASDEGGAASGVPADGAPAAQMVDRNVCARAIQEEVLADAACVGTAIWTVGSLPSVAGAVGGAVVTAATCGYAGLKSADADAACGRRGMDSVLTWSSDSS
jgi:hypothetical protein